MNEVVRTPLKITARQFEDMARKGAFSTVGRVELRGGMITLMSPVYLRHSTVTNHLFLAIWDAVRLAGAVFKVNSELSVDFGGSFVPTTDIVVWDPAQMGSAEDGPLVASAVRIAVEVADSSLSDDLGDKLLDYARSGLAEYWVADVKARVLFVHAGPGPEGYAKREVVRFGDPVTSPTTGLTVETGAL